MRLYNYESLKIHFHFTSLQQIMLFRRLLQTIPFYFISTLYILRSVWSRYKWSRNEMNFRYGYQKIYNFTTLITSLVLVLHTLNLFIGLFCFQQEVTF